MAVRDAVAGGIDWARFGRVVKRQRVAGLVDVGLKAAAVAVPSEVAGPIAHQAKRIVQQNLIAAAETARLTRLITAAGYPVLAVKGVALGALAYGSIAHKHSKDIDLLILPEHIAPVLTLLEADTYRMTHPAEHLTAAQRAVLPRYGKDVAMRRSAPSVQLELHWRLFTNDRLLPTLTAAAPVQLVAIGTRDSIPTLAPADLYAYLVLHGAIDGWSRMKSLADLNALVGRTDPETLVAWHEHASGLGVGVASEQALIMMANLFALPIPPDLHGKIGRSRRVRMLVAASYRLMAVRDGATEIDGWSYGRMLALALQPLLGRGLPYQWQIVRSVLYLQADMYRSKLPPALYPLYPLVRVPTWLANRVGRLARHIRNRDLSATVAAKSP